MGRGAKSGMLTARNSFRDDLFSGMEDMPGREVLTTSEEKLDAGPERVSLERPAVRHLLKDLQVNIRTSNRQPKEAGSEIMLGSHNKMSVWVAE